MRYAVKSFNGHTLNDASYETVGLNFATPAAADLNFIQMANGDPADAGVFAGRTKSIILWVTIKNYATRIALMEQLVTWLKRGTSGTLVATYVDGVDYQVMARVQGIVPEPKSAVRFTVTLQVGASSWSRVTAETDSWTANSGTLTKAITVGGVEETRLVASLTPTAAGSTGYRYQNLYKLIPPTSLKIGKRPWCITLDTAALVSGGKCQADCDDLRIFVGDKEVNRWIADPNTNHTHIWFVQNFDLGYSIKLRTAIAGSGQIGEMQFSTTQNAIDTLNKIPSSGILVHGTEWFQYSGKNLKYKKIGIVTRAAFGTTMQAHSIGDTMQFIPTPVWVLYGNSAATNPATDDAEYDYDKPVFDLSASDNSTWVYTASTVFYDAAHPERPGSWTPTDNCDGNISTNYNFTQNAEGGNPALGMEMACWQKSGAWQKENGSVYWSLTCPSGFTTVSLTGSKYRNTTRFPASAKLQRSPNASGWYDVWSETTPVNVNTWTAFTHNSASVSGNYIRVILSGSMSATANAAAYFEMLTATVVFSTTLLPSGALLGEGSNYPMAVTLKNNTTGDLITVTYPMLTNKTLLVDGENYVVTYDGKPAANAMDLDDDSRDVWIRVNPGSNTLAIAPVTSGDDIGTISVALSWYPRRP